MFGPRAKADGLGPGHDDRVRNCELFNFGCSFDVSWLTLSLLFHLEWPLSINLHLSECSNWIHGSLMRFVLLHTCLGLHP